MDAASRPETDYGYLLKIMEERCRGKSAPAVLDFGCGKGQYALYMRRRGIDIHGAEIDEDALGAARRAFEAEGFDPSCLKQIPGRSDMCVTGEGYRLPFDDGAFDFIYSMVVFEHIFNLPETLAELSRVLKSDGAIFTCFPPGEAIVEPHLMLPFAHWLPYSRTRKWYIEIYNRLGAGTFRGGDAQNEILKKYTFYRSTARMNRELGKLFEINDMGITDFRKKYLSDGKVKAGPLSPAVDALYKKFRFRNVILTKKRRAGV